MALKLRKDIKKSSYYVWFLGAKESKGLRGTDFILPVIQHLEKREKDIEPFKVTLQVSHKGLKIIQNIVANINNNGKNSKPKNETIKHFIPHNTITCVHQVDDVIACILLLFNPVTKCPLHVHAYRCDSLETAGLLRQQLQLLIDRPENQKKFAEIENRLLVSERTKKEAAAAAAANSARKNVNKVDSSLGSDTGTSTATRESDSSDDRYNTADTSRITALYDSLAAELRAKLSKSNQPILLPPRDYDTVHRQKGNLTGIELRRCLNSNIVGPPTTTLNSNSNSGGGGVGGGGKKTGGGKAVGRLESSGGSSGIGSDHAPSPESPVDTVGGVGGGGHVMMGMMGVVGGRGGYGEGVVVGAVERGGGGGDGHSTSDEEWNDHYPDPSIYLLNQSIIPKPHLPPSQLSPPQYYDDKNPSSSPKYLDEQEHQQHDTKYRDEQQDNYRKKLAQRQHHPPPDQDGTAPNGGRYYVERHRSLEERQRSQEELGRQSRYIGTRMEMYKKQEREQQGKSRKFEAKRYSMDEDDGFEDNEIVYRTKSRQDQIRPRSNYFESELPVQPVPKTRHHRDKDLSYMPPNRQSMPPNAHYGDDYRQPKHANGLGRHFVQRENEFFDQAQPINRYRNCGDYFEDNNSLGRRQQQQKELEKATSPRERFYDAKEKFLLLEKERDEMQMKMRQQQLLQQQQEAPISPICKEQPYLKRHENLTRYNYDQQPLSIHNHPKPAPRNNLNPKQSLQQQAVDFPLDPRDHINNNNNNNNNQSHQQPPVVRYRNQNNSNNNNGHHLENSRIASSPGGNNNAGGGRHGGINAAASTVATAMLDHRYHHQQQRHLPVDKYDQKRRSMYNLIEDEHRRNSNEIAQELKRRSYMESGGTAGGEYYGGGSGGDRRGGGFDTGEKEKELAYSTLEKDQFLYGKDPQFSKSSIELDKLGELSVFTKQPKGAATSGGHNGVKHPVAGCRHSYVEPKYRPDKVKKQFADMLHRTNSSVSNNGRVGIASIHPY